MTQTEKPWHDPFLLSFLRGFSLGLQYRYLMMKVLWYDDTFRTRYVHHTHTTYYLYFVRAVNICVEDFQAVMFWSGGCVYRVEGGPIAWKQPFPGGNIFSSCFFSIFNPFHLVFTSGATGYRYTLYYIHEKTCCNQVPGNSLIIIFILNFFVLTLLEFFGTCTSPSSTNAKVKSSSFYM